MEFIVHNIAVSYLIQPLQEPGAGNNSQSTILFNKLAVICLMFHLPDGCCCAFIFEQTEIYQPKKNNLKPDLREIKCFVK
jgi:hypothetical protein